VILLILNNLFDLNKSIQIGFEFKLLVTLRYDILLIVKLYE